MRTDLSDYLIHWTRGPTPAEAFQRLKSIVFEQRLLGGTEMRKGMHPSVCFTESPQRQFDHIVTRYSPFGIQVKKSWAFARGGRPVIYQRDSEYAALPDLFKWRHVRYEPDAEPPVDFSWEREWRIPVSELSLSESHFDIIVSTAKWAEALHSEQAAREEFRVWGEVIGYGDFMNYQPRNPLAQNIIVLTL